MRRPLSVLIIAWLFILTGTTGFAYHVSEMYREDSFATDHVLAMLVSIVAIVGGIFVLRAYNPGRWLIILWLIYHVLLSYFHGWTPMIIHVVLLIAVGYFLFRRDAKEFFKTRSTKAG
jgi:hypothetical protein